MSRKALIGVAAAVLTLGALTIAPPAAGAATATEVLQECRKDTVTALNVSPASPATVDSLDGTVNVTLTAVSKPDSSSDATVLTGKWFFIVDGDSLTAQTSPVLVRVVDVGTHTFAVGFLPDSNHDQRGYCGSKSDEVTYKVIVVQTTPGPTVTETTPGPTVTETTSVPVDRPASGSSGPGFTG